MDTKFIEGPEATAPFCGPVFIHGLTSGRREEVQLRGSPRETEAKLAGFAVGVTTYLHGRLLPMRPAVKWFAAGRDCSVDRLGFADPGGEYIALADHLHGRQLVDTALHEVRHLAQRGVKFSNGEAEADASGFAARWTPVVLRAARESRGRLSELAVMDAAKPSGRAPHGDLRICRRTGGLWQYNARTMQDAWRELCPDY